MSSHPVSGHLYGPPPPHIVFSYGEKILAEVRGHPLAMRHAYAAAERSISYLAPPSEVGPTLHMLRRARAVVYCGPVCMDVREIIGQHNKDRELDFLLMMKGYSRVPVTSNPTYVFTIVLSDDGQHAIGLIKSKGPEQLIGKIAFPGGRVKAGETARQAASRELHEATGVTVRPQEMVFIANNEEMTVFAARSDAVLTARTSKDEEVVVLAVERHKHYLGKVPQAYLAEFKILLMAAEAAV